jgi:hypothetical protein
MGITRSSQNGRGKAGNGRAAHHKVACMLREARGGPDGPNSAGDLRGRRGCSRLCTRCRLDCFILDVPGSGSELMGASAWLDVDHGDGTTARWLWWRSGACSTRQN